MPTETQNYKLVTGVVSDDFVEPDHINHVADVVDRVVGSFLQRLMTAGVYAGWEIGAAKQVSAGEGLIRGCWCSTVNPQDVADLTDDAVNYVFAESADTSGWDGSVTVRAQLSSIGPTGSLLLGSIELDASGAVVAVDNDIEGVDRQCYELAWQTLEGSGSVASVPAGDDAVVVIEHDALRLPGAIEFDIEDEDFTWEIDRTHAAASFRVTATNTGASPADMDYTWLRHGIAE